MPVFIALVRGINVGGNTLKMERLRALCTDLGIKNIQTYVQSGNIVFEGAGSASDWAARLERKLAGQCRLPVSVLVRTAGEMARVVAANPFLREKGVDPSKLHVSFLGRAATEAALDRLRAIDAGADRFHSLATEIYLHCPNGYGRTKLSNNAIEKLLSLRATTRNWNTVQKLFEMGNAR